MSGRSRACSIVTRAQPPAAAGFFLGDGRPVLVTGTQGPVVGVIGEDDAAGRSWSIRPAALTAEPGPFIRRVPRTAMTAIALVS